MKKLLLATVLAALPVVAMAQTNAQSHAPVFAHTPSATSAVEDAHTGTADASGNPTSTGIDNKSITVDIKAQIDKAVHIEHVNNEMKFKFDKLFQTKESTAQFKVFANCPYTIKASTNNTLTGSGTAAGKFLPYELLVNKKLISSGQAATTEQTVPGTTQAVEVQDSTRGATASPFAGQTVDMSVRINSSVYHHGDYAGSFTLEIAAQ